MNNQPSILVIDDEAAIRKLLEITLQSEGYAVTHSGTAREGIIRAAAHPPDMIILDIGLPDKNGHEVLKELRDWYNRPIIILSVQNSEEDIVQALDNGASDYLVKPFRTGELTARIRSALRKSNRHEPEPVIGCGPLQIDLAARRVKKNGEAVKLTSTEYNLLSLLARNEGMVLTHHYLLREIWGPGYVSQSQYLRVFIAQIRKKIEEDPDRPTCILTEPGVGYRFVCSNENSL